MEINWVFFVKAIVLGLFAATCRIWDYNFSPKLMAGMLVQICICVHDLGDAGLYGAVLQIWIVCGLGGGGCDGGICDHRRVCGVHNPMRNMTPVFFATTSRSVGSYQVGGCRVGPELRTDVLRVSVHTSGLLRFTTMRASIPVCPPRARLHASSLERERLCTENRAKKRFARACGATCTRALGFCMCLQASAHDRRVGSCTAPTALCRLLRIGTSSAL